MKRIFYLLALTILSLLPAEMRGEIQFASSSALSSGKWVKIGVTESGLYEISYEKLRSLGFTNPAAVSVYGTGGKQLEENFTTAAGVTVYKDDLKPVGAVHAADKLIFYGQGVEEIEYLPNLTEESGGFERKNRNFYTECGYYFLTDKDEKSFLMEEEKIAASAADSLLSEGKDYLYHEEDKTLGVKGTGRLFLGEDFSRTRLTDRYTWDYSCPDMIPERGGYMVAPVYRERLTSGIVSFGIEGGSPNYNLWTQMPRVPVLGVVGDAPVKIGIPSVAGKVFAEVKLDPYCANTIHFAHLDYWLINYAKRVPTLLSESQSRILFDSLRNGEIYRFKLNSPGYMAIRIDSKKPTKLFKADSEGMITFRGENTEARIVVFDPQRELYSPICYSDVANSDLHGAAEEGADMLIIAVKQLKNSAERLAELHRVRDGMKVLVVDDESLYNEFSSGRPDAMAYRALSKKLYISDKNKLKYLILVGPALGNIKQSAELGSLPSRLIFPQTGIENHEILAYNHIDFYGNLDAYTALSPERRRLNINVGLIPADNEAELENYIDKLERYLDYDGYARITNHTYHHGGVLDSNMHIRQSSDVGKEMDKTSDGRFRHTFGASAALMNGQNQREIIKGFNDASLLTYFGHGTPEAIDSYALLFKNSDVRKLSNTSTPVMLLAACNLTYTDRGYRGVCERLVMNTKHGLIGCIASMRDTYANNNFDMYKRFSEYIASKGITDDSDKPITFGEAYTYMKNNYYVQNELTYTLIGDPAVPLVTAVANIETDSIKMLPAPGNNLTIKGSVVDKSGKLISGFEGDILARILIPGRTQLLEPDFNPPTTDTIYYPYKHPSAEIAIAKGKVEQGKFSLDIRMPRAAMACVGDSLELSLSAFDNARFTGAGAFMKLPYSPDMASADSISDTRCPIIEEFSYDSRSRSLLLSVADDMGMNISSLPFSEGLVVKLDGELLENVSELDKTPDESGRGYKVAIPLAPLSDGPHFAAVRVADDAGNISDCELTFIVGRSNAAQLTLEEGPITDVARFGVAEGFDSLPDDLYAIVTDSTGEIVQTIRMVEGKGEWNLTDRGGQRVAPGLYRLNVMSAGSDTSFLSEEKLLPVM